jgi:hypothetical protein
VSDHGGRGLTFEWFIGQLADALLDRMEARDEGLISQRDRRGLMGRRHIDAVKRRIADELAAGTEPRTAFQRGRDYLLTPAAAREELARLSGDRGRAPKTSPRRGAPRPRSTEASKKRAESDEKAAVRRELETALRRET